MYHYTNYTKWFKESENLQKAFDQLFELFRNLLLQTNGDVNEAMHWMTMLNNRHHFTDEMNKFIERLKKEGLISEQDSV